MTINDDKIILLDFKVLRRLRVYVIIFKYILKMYL